MSRKKTSPRPSERCGCGDLHPALSHSRKGDWCGRFGSSQIAAAVPTPVAVPTRRFYEAAVLDAIRFRSYASEGLAQVPTMILCAAVTASPTRSRAPETLVEFSSSICNHRGDPVRQAKAEEKVVRLPACEHGSGSGDHWHGGGWAVGSDGLLTPLERFLNRSSPGRTGS